jgi:signal peptide peptidase SppA
MSDVRQEEGLSALMDGIVAETWAMEPHHLERLLAMARAAGLGLAPPSPPEAAALSAGGGGEPAYQVVDGVAHIPIRGYLLKSVPAWMKRWGIDATSLSDTVGVIERADQDPAVRSIVLDVDSPGGTISGTIELGEAVAAAKKPTAAHGSGMVASAAYWIASQAKRVTATPSTPIGSIGVYRVLYDTSAAYEKWGVKVHVVRTHELKGAGVDGSKLTEAQLAAEQVLINSAGDLFQRAVASGRKLGPEAVKAVATGEVWFAQDAQSRGLIDGVEAAQRAHDFARGSNTPLVGERKATMADNNTAPAATAAEVEKLKADLAAAKAEGEKNKALAEAREAALAAQEQARKDLVLQAGIEAGRVAPAMVESMKKLAAVSTVDELTATIKGLPVVVRKDPQADSTNPESRDSTDSASSADQRIAKALGISVEKMERFGNVKAVLPDGKLLGKDGVVREFKKGGN